MKLRPLIGFTLLIALVGARLATGPTSLPLHRDFDLALNTSSSAETMEGAPSDSIDLVSTAAGDEDRWTLSVARGTKLLTGMKGSDTEAATLYNLPSTAESPFDGDLVETLRTWGYNDNTPTMQSTIDKECNMASPSGHLLSKTLHDLGLQTQSHLKGGPNQCFWITHHSGPAVIIDPDEGEMPPKKEQYYKIPGCEKAYRCTGAESTIGVNAAGGAIFAINMVGAASAAHRLWGKKPTTEQLPHIRSTSDFAWAFWNRAVTANPGADLKNIKYFFTTMIINTETNRHIKRALQTLTPPIEDAIGWPGHEFSMDTEAGKALLGSPVGRWAGYFLMQHKRQLGGSKFIDRVRVFKSEKAGSLPYLLFYVDGNGAGPVPSPTPGGEGADVGGLVKKKVTKKIVKVRSAGKRKALRWKL